MKRDAFIEPTLGELKVGIRSRIKAYFTAWEIFCRKISCHIVSISASYKFYTYTIKSLTYLDLRRSRQDLQPCSRTALNLSAHIPNEYYFQGQYYYKSSDTR